MRFEVAGDAKPARRFNHPFAADTFGNLHGNGVDRTRCRLAQGHAAVILAVVIARFPVGDLDGAIHILVVGGDALFQRGEEHDRLEGRTGLAARLRCAVERTVKVVAAADHRTHGTIGRQRHQSGLIHVLLLRFAIHQAVDGAFGPPCRRLSMVV